MSVGSSTVSKPAAWVSPRASSKDDTTPSAADEAETETWADRVYAALPLFLVGGACLFIAVDLYLAGTPTLFGGGSARLSPWTLFLALAVTGIAAGTLALFLEEEPPAPTEVVAVGAKPAAPPAWDESTIPPEKPAHMPRRTWERYPDLPMETEIPPDPGVASLSPDIVLAQIDEIEASLRKKPPPSGSP